MGLFKSWDKRRWENAHSIRSYAAERLDNHINLPSPSSKDPEEWASGNVPIFNFKFNMGGPWFSARVPIPALMTSKQIMRYGDELYGQIILQVVEHDRKQGVAPPNCPRLSPNDPCPRCEKHEKLPNDYICSSCRYGS